MRTGTDNLPILNEAVQPGQPGQPGAGDYAGVNIPSVWRDAQSQAAAKVDALSSNGMDEIEIVPAQAGGLSIGNANRIGHKGACRRPCGCWRA